MNTGLLYALTVLVAVMQIGLIHNRTKATKYTETIEAPFLRMLMLFEIFCVADFLWGICVSYYFHTPRNLFMAVTYAYHILAAVSAYIWFGYGLFYVKVEGTEKLGMDIFRNFLLMIQLVIIFSNVISHSLFSLSEDGQYVTGEARPIIYSLQFTYYIFLILYAIIKIILQRENKDVYKRMLLFSLIPFIFSIAQYIFYDAAMYSLGFMFSAFAIYLFNITAQREAYMELKNKEQSLLIRERESEMKNQATTTFLFNMSHDIRTPMNAILGYTSLIEKSRDDVEKFNSYINSMKEASQHLLGIINSILEMSRIESGKMELNDDELWNINDFIGTVASVMREGANKKNQSLEIETEVKHEHVYCDSTKLREIFLNIIGNSVKYTPEGGVIHMRLEELPCRKKGYLIYQTTIADNGIGISKEFLPYVFDSFERERTSTESQIGGTGLGMGITKRLVEMMGGNIKVESELGKGTTVTFQVIHKIASKENVALKKEEDETRISAEVFAGKRILLAEDNDMNAEILTEILKKFGFEVERAEDGVVCVDMMERAEAGYYKLIFMDVQMPNTNGYKATIIIRRLPDAEKRNIPIIAMTANAFDTDYKNAMQAGMNDFLTKPINMKELRRVLGKWGIDE